MIKVLFVYTHTVLGGGETMLIHTISGLDRKKISPVAAVSPRNERLIAELRRLGVPVVLINDVNRPLKNKFLKTIVQIPRFVFLNIKIGVVIARENPDIVHAGLFYSALWSVLPARMLGKKFVWVGQTLSDFFAYPFLSKFLMRFSHVTILTCADFNRLLRERGMAHAGTTEVIYTGVAQDAFRERAGGPLLVIGEEHISRPIVAMIARFDESQKGFGHFWEMAHIIHGKMPHVQFMIIGAPVNAAEHEFKSRLDILAEKFNIKDVLHYPGFVSNLPPVFPYLDVVVIPSTYEAPSGVAIEAGAAGRPVVAFAVGGIPEVVQDGKTGYLLPYGDAAGLAEKTMLLLGDSKKSDAMGVAGREFVKEHFSEERLAENYLNLYKSLVSKK